MLSSCSPSDCHRTPTLPGNALRAFTQTLGHLFLLRPSPPLPSIFPLYYCSIHVGKSPATGRCAMLAAQTNSDGPRAPCNNNLHERVAVPLDGVAAIPCVCYPLLRFAVTLGASSASCSSRTRSPPPLPLSPTAVFVSSSFCFNIFSLGLFYFSFSPPCFGIRLTVLSTHLCRAYASHAHVGGFPLARCASHAVNLTPHPERVCWTCSGFVRSHVADSHLCNNAVGRLSVALLCLSFSFYISLAK